MCVTCVDTDFHFSGANSQEGKASSQSRHKCRLVGGRQLFFNAIEPSYSPPVTNPTRNSSPCTLTSTGC